MKIQAPSFLLRAFLLLSLLLGVGVRSALAAPFDQAFIDAMVPHHMMAAEMAQLAVTKAQHPELRRMAQMIVRDQNKEIAQLKQWRKAWYGSAVVPMHHMSHTMKGKTMRGMMKGADKTTMHESQMMGLPMKMEMDMGKLRGAHGATFDKMFIQMMVPHHSGAIVMADEAIRRSARPEIRRLSHKIIDAQAEEIGTMRAWHRRWFGPM